MDLKEIRIDNRMINEFSPSLNIKVSRSGLISNIQGVHRDAYKSKLKFKVEKIIRN